METKFFVVRAFRYANEEHKWEYSLIGMYDDISVAKQAYHDNLGRTIKDSNDFAFAILFDSWGNTIEKEYDNKYIPEE